MNTATSASATSAPATAAEARNALREAPVVAVLRAPDATGYAPAVAALAAAGIRFLELTLTTPGTIGRLERLRGEVPKHTQLGIGTVTTTAEADAAIAAGADFIVTPVTDPAIVQRAVQAGVPVFPGGMTPTELHRGWAAGAAAVKVFPASAVGAGYLGQLRGPFPDIEVLPSGGVGLSDIRPWMRAGAAAVSLGGALVKDAFDGGSMIALCSRAREAMGRALEGRDGR